MTTFTITPGASDPLVFAPLQPDGALPDLTGAAMQLRIQAGPACLALDGLPTVDGFEVAAALIDLPPRLYRATVYFDWGEGWRKSGDIVLNIEGGC